MVQADLVLGNGRVFTADADMPLADAVAISGDRVAAVGRDADIGALVGPGTEVIDLKGGLLTPGFTDAHVHVATSGLEQLRLTFGDCDNAADALEFVGRYAAEHRDEPWIIGGGWSQAWFERGCPDALTLDSVVADRPVLITNSDGHGAWANSRALEVAGISADTQDPGDGRIERRPDGRPQGTLHEGAMALVQRHAPEDTVDDFARGLIRGQEEMLMYGITGWQEAAVNAEVQEAYLQVAASGRLVGDVVGALWWDRHQGLEQVHELVGRREQSAPGFRPTSVKLMLDGVAENYTASLLDPYLDDAGRVTTNTGIDLIDPGELMEIVTILDRHDFQCHFHAVGDGAVRSALDAVEAARRSNGPADNRHHIAHIQFVHPDDISRFAELSAIANAQPLWAFNDDYQIELTRPFITPERDSWQYPFGSLLRAGAALGMGSDWNVSTANVMEEIAVAINRTGPDGGPPLGPEQALSPVEALTAFTMGSAYINNSEQDRGSLEVGKLADVVVFDRDPFVAGDFGDTEVSLTFVRGNVAYEGC
ncbi:MAG TPA: amidohydrolase [Acidimicrobiia bacterium]|nr:amidohydrolase [Acidimicrobiia bacterium]